MCDIRLIRCCLPGGVVQFFVQRVSDDQRRDRKDDDDAEDGFGFVFHCGVVMGYVLIIPRLTLFL